MPVTRLAPSVGVGETDAHPELTVRRPAFDWDGVPVSWLPEDPVAGQVINVIHAALPTGERWFVDIYREALPLVTEPRLRHEMKRFMGQEAVHARSHAGFVEHMDAQGYDTAPMEALIERRIAAWCALADRVLGRRRALGAKVAVIAGVEHFTAVLGEWALTTDVFDRGDPAVAAILRWHGAEELEHKCVAFDVHQVVNRGSYPKRLAGFAIATFELAVFWHHGVRHLLDRDPWAPATGRRRAIVRSLRRGNLPGRVLLGALDYAKPSFHPSDRPTLALTRAYFATSSAGGAS